MIKKMARVSKTSPFRPRGQPDTRPRGQPELQPNTEEEKKDEEKSSSSSSTTSSSTSEKITQDKKQQKAKGKTPMQAKKGNRKTTLYEIINGLFRAKGTVTKRGRGKSMAYTARLWSKHHPRIDVHVSSDDEPNADPKPKGTQDKKQGKTKGKRPMQAKYASQKTILARGIVTRRGRGKSAASTIRLWSKHNPRSPTKGAHDVQKSKNAYIKVKEEDDVFQTSETDSEEICKRINIERHNDGDETDDDGRGAGTHRNLTSLGIEVVGK